MVRAKWISGVVVDLEAVESIARISGDRSLLISHDHSRDAEVLRDIEMYGGQQWTALCLVRAVQRHTGQVVLDNFTVFSKYF